VILPRPAKAIKGEQRNDLVPPIDVEKRLADQLATAIPDLVRGFLSTVIYALMSAEAAAFGGRRLTVELALAPGVEVLIDVGAAARHRRLRHRPLLAKTLGQGRLRVAD
jgi:hypothetical protein